MTGLATSLSPLRYFPCQIGENKDSVKPGRFKIRRNASGPRDLFDQYKTITNTVCIILRLGMSDGNSLVMEPIFDKENKLSIQDVRKSVII